MFVLQIAGDVLGHKRNIEVTFPHRPSLQLICTVAETILPLQDSHDRRPWCPPGAVDASTSAGFSPPSPCHRPTSVGDYVVESIACINAATQQWEEVYSASQLTSGAQVYCFCPLQHHRVAVVQAKGSTPLSAHHGARPPIPLPLPDTLPVVTEVQDHWVNADRPGVIPEPQERLAWGCSIAVPASEEASRSFPRGHSGKHADQSLFSCVSAVNSRHACDAREADTAAAALSSQQVRSASRCFTSNSPSAIQPSYLCQGGGSEPPFYGAMQRRNAINRSSLPDYPRCNTEDSWLSFASRFPPTKAVAHTRLCKDPYALYKSIYPVLSYRGSGRRSLEASAEHSERSSCNYASSASAMPLLSGGGGHRYAQLGERLGLLFDVLLQLDTQETGAERHYLLLRDFYLLCSRLNSSTAAVDREGGSAVSQHPLNLTAELATQFGLTWDDVLRSADKDRDGCITYREWIAYGIEHPEVIQLLCQGVRQLPLHMNEALRRLRRHSGSRSRSQYSSSSPALLHHDLDSGKEKARNAGTSSTHAPYPCRIRGAGSSERVRRMAAEDEEMSHTCAVFNGRCEACRELAAQSLEERLRWASKPTPFAGTLRH
ncbi:hypothetical protein ABL78_2969 [Leptomonas seymouri]|uniref:EF-hand domain-containing protein n=1 Tax=Leptomonas seymouri TaxID=5684 RepID=A0A0N1I8H2_LEPSE|nr:hypothetical protein ABL78_2969 [Leptomonas seymouri]|eukprot:KPI87930.1 hypothetical protein ABL78_2969 [Leptomonas seymouri]